MLVVEPGLIVLRLEGDLRFGATAGGLLDGDHDHVILYTPFAVVGEDDSDVLSALERALATPDSELQARRHIGDLEQRILEELRRGVGRVPKGRSHG